MHPAEMTSEREFDITAPLFHILVWLRHLATIKSTIWQITDVISIAAKKKPLARSEDAVSFNWHRKLNFRRKWNCEIFLDFFNVFHHFLNFI